MRHAIRCHGAPSVSRYRVNTVSMYYARPTSTLEKETTIRSRHFSIGGRSRQQSPSRSSRMRRDPVQASNGNRSSNDLRSCFMSLRDQHVKLTDVPLVQPCGRGVRSGNGNSWPFFSVCDVATDFRRLGLKLRNVASDARSRPGQPAFLAIVPRSACAASAVMH